jgi:two-component system response regulator
MSLPAEVEILLVEDNPSDVELTLRALKARNLANQVFVARDGAEALEFFFERTKSLPVVVLTSSSDEPDIAAAYRLGANSYIVKPADFEAFARAVSELGLFWLLLNEQPR